MVSGTAQNTGTARPWPAVSSAVVAIAILAGAFMRQAFEVAPNHDNVWLLISAARLVDGGRYYADFFELNPPLYMVVISPALFVADIPGVDRYDGFILWVLGLIAGSTLFAYRWLAVLAASASRPVPLLIALYVATLGLLPDYAFGQREHISVILVFPYILWLFTLDRAPVVGARGVAATVGLAAVGFFIKPYFLVVPAALVAVHGILHGHWRGLLKVHGLAFGLVGSGYAVAMVAIFPEWFDVAAIAMRAYGAYDPGMARVLYGIGLHFLIAANIWIVAELLTGNDRVRAAGRLSFAAAAGFLVAVALQRKGFPYHYLPARSLNLLAVGIVVLLAFPGARVLFDRIRERPGLSLRALTAGLMVASLALSTILQARLVSVSHLSRADVEASGIYAHLAELAQDGSVMIVSTSLGVLPAVSMLDLDWASRQPAHWIVPGVARLEREDDGDAARPTYLRRLATALVVEDLERYAPSLVAVYTGPHHTLPPGFDLLSFYESDRDFAAIWSSYRQVRQDGHWRFFARDANSG